MKDSKKNSLKKQLQKGTIKKKLPDTSEIEEITKKVYEKKDPIHEEIKEPSQRTTLDIPKSIHIAAKVEAMKDGISLKDFVLKLIRLELKRRNDL
jgi:predicted HicB family RNase H-like nuclease